MEKKVVSLNEFKAKKDLRKKLDTYSNYLRSLSHSQLETEVNTLLDEFNLDEIPKNFYFKCQIILQEISSRATGSTKIRIDKLSKETLKLLN